MYSKSQAATENNFHLPQPKKMNQKNKIVFQWIIFFEKKMKDWIRLLFLDLINSEASTLSDWILVVEKSENIFKILA